MLNHNCVSCIFSEHVSDSFSTLSVCDSGVFIRRVVFSPLSPSLNLSITAALCFSSSHFLFLLPTRSHEAWVSSLFPLSASLLRSRCWIAYRKGLVLLNERCSAIVLQMMMHRVPRSLSTIYYSYTLCTTSCLFSIHKSRIWIKQMYTFILEKNKIKSHTFRCMILFFSLSHWACIFHRGLQLYKHLVKTCKIMQ